MGILRVLTSQPLPCRCVAGIYERYDGSVVAIVDVRHPSCRDPHHAVGTTLPPTAAPVRRMASAQQPQPRH
jgi:hypothetical protein